MTVTLNTLFECDEYVISHGYSIPLQLMHTQWQKLRYLFPVCFPQFPAG